MILEVHKISNPISSGDCVLNLLLQRYNTKFNPLLSLRVLDLPLRGIPEYSGIYMYVPLLPSVSSHLA